MAFVLNCTLESIEYRGLRTGVGQKSGRTWMSLVLEDSNSCQVEVAVPNDLQSDIYSLHLQKGDYLNVAIRATARSDGQSYVQLLAVPELVEDGE